MAVQNLKYGFYCKESNYIGNIPGKLLKVTIIYCKREIDLAKKDFVRKFFNKFYNIY